jgi:hypothetical protein
VAAALLVVQDRNHTAVGLVEVVEDILIRRKVVVEVEVDIVMVDTVDGQEVGLPEGKVVEEDDHIVTQVVCRLVAVRSASQPAASCPVLHCSFLASVPDHDAEIANA